MSGIIDHLAKKFGSHTALADAAGVKQNTVSGWKETTGLVPSGRIPRVMEAARQKGIALTYEDFFPKDDGQPEPERVAS